MENVVISPHLAFLDPSETWDRLSGRSYVPCTGCFGKSAVDHPALVTLAFGEHQRDWPFTKTAHCNLVRPIEIEIALTYEETA